MIYLDTSALLKLIFSEDESAAVKKFLPHDASTVSSALLLVEARRSTLRRAPSRLPRLEIILARMKFVAISDAVLEAASRLPDPMLRSLDAIHLATALLIREDVDTVVSYDDRLLAAAAAHGLPTASPA